MNEYKKRDVVATLHPNHTWEKVVFDPWQQTTYDPNDTVTDSDWYDERYSYGGSDVALLAEKLSAEDAERIGLIWKVLDDGELMPEVTRIARALAAGPTKGYGLLKRALYASHGNSLDAQLDLERDLQRDAGFSEDYREGVAAFMEKRKPQFKGR